MEPGEYSTNILSSVRITGLLLIPLTDFIPQSNYGTIHYEYFELQSVLPGLGRRQLQKIEAGWRHGGVLAHCDTVRDGIWKFKSVAENGLDSQKDGSSAIHSSVDVEEYGLKLSLREKGIYEPASLIRGKVASSNNYSASSISSSPSSSLDSTIRNSQSLNSRAVQGNSGQAIIHEPPIPSPGIKSASIINWPSPKDIHECFISAVLGSIVFFLCRDHGFLPLNSRTLILADPQASGIATSNMALETDSLTLATLDISLTSLGTLVIKGHCDIAPGLQNILSSLNTKDAPSIHVPGTALWLAPGGNAAKYYGSQNDKDLSGNLLVAPFHANSSDHRQHGLNEATIQSWKSKCLEWLSAKGLNSAVLEEGGWVFVQVLSGSALNFSSDYPAQPILEDLAVVPWPALLCFQTASNGIRELQPLTLSLGSRDPLSFAEEWLASKDDRISQISKRQKDRQAAEIRSKEQADLDARPIQSVTYSPAALRRGSNAGAMYPTPPDAVHHPVGATPSFDGNVSTPGNPVALFAHDTDHLPQTSHAGLGSTDADVWPSSGSKKDQTHTSMNFNDNDNDNDDNLFGDDVVGDLFGDITDADFNFFDEPDDVPFEEHNNSTSNAAVDLSKNHDIIDAMIVDPPATQPHNSAQPDNRISDFTDQNDSVVTADIIKHEAQERDTKQETKEPIPKEIVKPIKEPPRPNISSPFSMEYVYKTIVQDSPLGKQSSGLRRDSVFNKVNFESSLLSVNEKYSAHGRFKFIENKSSIPQKESSIIPTTEYLGRKRKLTDGDQESRRLSRILQGGFQRKQAYDNSGDHVEAADFSPSSSISDPDDLSQTSDTTLLILNPGVKRKRVGSDSGDDMASSFNALAVEYAQSVSTPMSTQMPLLEADPADWSLASYFVTPEPDIHSNTLSDLECIASAQILADQAVSGVIKLPISDGIPANDSQSNSHKTSCTRELMFRLTKATKTCLKEVLSCTMRTFLDIQGIPVVNQGLRLPPRPTPHPRGHQAIDGLRLLSPFPIPSPQLEVRRSDSKLTVLPSAINFWDNLGLSPSEGNKDVSAVCIYPSFDGVAENANIFLDQMHSIYESSRLGSHEKIVTKDLPSGLIPFTVDPAPQINKAHQLSTLKETMGRLSRILSTLPMEEKNFVIYFVYPVDNSAILVHICTAFQHLFNLYRKLLSDRKVSIANDLVLQLIPLSFIASPTSLTVPSPSEYIRLAMEVYDRCIGFTTYSSTSAILLEQPLPRNIDFKLSPNPSASVFQENSCLHIAYAQSIDDRWITAAWTDNRGAQQMTASYCLGRKNELLSMSFSDIANEIWETTLDIMSRKKIHWRIMISRVGVMAPSEIEFWTGLASTESDARVNLTLITVQTDPSLRLLPPHITLSPNANAPQSVITPVSTPQASQTSILSPEPASTPAREHTSTTATTGDPVEPDADARLLDFTDQCWGAVLSHRLNNSNSLLELNTALISGYLMKRSGANLDDPPVVIEVNIVHCEVVGNPRTFHEGLLREILVYYRGLGTLARARGVVDRTNDVRPWHIAAAEKAVKALYALM